MTPIPWREATMPPPTRPGRALGASGQSTLEITLLLVTVLVTAGAMVSVMRRGFAGSLWRAFGGGQSSPYLAGQSSGTTQLRVQQSHRDEFIGTQLKDDNELPVVVYRIKSSVNDYISQHRRERVALTP